MRRLVIAMNEHISITDLYEFFNVSYFYAKNILFSFQERGCIKLRIRPMVQLLSLDSKLILLFK